ncbi:RsfA family transcriptional regulator [Bacillus sp. 03113]|uniref:RsfA family transcriptional regulator n=1 Tax=Bacillus sp. 03113 TaxID=2578211 RepID=UPI001143C805|nr:RsfA family transcriptional regulator [Bacillus sp. 03113]
MKVRQDAWTDEDDFLLAETVLRHVREGSTQLNAFEEVGDKLNRTSAACGFRWNAVVRHNYEKALQLAKKQRKQRNRMLGKEQGGKKKLLYSPPVASVENLDVFTPSLQAETEGFHVEFAEEEEIKLPLSYSDPSGINLDMVISYLQSLGHSYLQVEGLKNENERLKRELNEVSNRNKVLEDKLAHLETNSETIQEDYETIMKIMNRARKLVLLEEEERPSTKFKMDRNGNLEKVAE